MGLEGYADAPDPERKLRDAMGDHDYLVDLWQMGEQMRLFLETPAGAYLERTFRQDFNAAMQRLLDADDPTSERGRLAHSEARLNLRLLEKIQEVVTAGAEAEAVIISGDKEQMQ